MKRKLFRVIKILSIILCVGLVLTAIGYWGIYDLRRPRFYAPSIEETALLDQAQQLSFAGPVDDKEYQINKAGFNAILHFAVEERPAEDIKKQLIELNSDDIGMWNSQQLFSFEQDDIDILVYPAFYTPLLVKMGYGWYDTQNGNLYGWKYGHEAAAGKPNYRHNYSFLIRVQDKAYRFDIFCNTSSAITALTETVAFYNAME